MPEPSNTDNENSSNKTTPTPGKTTDISGSAPHTSLNKPPPDGTYLGFDFGLKRIGVSAGNSESLSAMPLKTVTNHSGTPDWATLDQLVQEWQPAGLVTGLPLDMDGQSQSITEHAEGFARRINRRYQLPVFRMDERLSSFAAQDIIKENRKMGASRKTRREDIDKIAATVILRLWLEAHFDK